MFAQNSGRMMSGIGVQAAKDVVKWPLTVTYFYNIWRNFTVIAWNLRERHIHSFSTVKDVRIIFTKIGL